jgi:hypothetical protein
LIEMPFALWLLILGIIMPLICLVTLGMRYTFFTNACKQAVHAAVHTQSFQQDFPPDLSAQTVANDTAKKCCQAFSGVKLNSVTTSIVVTPMSIPGLTTPYDVDTFAREVSENTQGLNK